MKKILVVISLIFVSLMSMAQHTYITQIKNIETTDTAKYCVDIFKQLDYLGVYSVEFSQPTKTFLVKSKKFLHPTIIGDYFIASGYKVISFFETGESKQFIILPDTTKSKKLK